MIKYKKQNNENMYKATIDGMKWYCTTRPCNRHYQAIQEWVAEGNTIAEAD